MAIEQIRLEKFLELRKLYPVFDVRSPGEFRHAGIPGAINLPLFTDEERAVVGTAYKKESREKAIRIGLGFFGTKMADLVIRAEELCVVPDQDERDDKKRTLILHCWRGGMRSAGMAWLLDLYGFKVYTLVGGYKSFRKWALESFENTGPLNVIGGYTGSGKTEILHAIGARGETVIDLEALAAHKGSAFGNLEGIKQPSQEFFENKLALAFFEAREKNRDIWIEDESRRIGDLNLPEAIFKRKETHPVFFISIPFEQRLDYLLSGYGKGNPEAFKEAILRIKKRLGPTETRKAIDYLTGNDMRGCFEILLKYYDKLYLKSVFGLKEKIPRKTITIHCPDTDSLTNARQILKIAKTPLLHES